MGGACFVRAKIGIKGKVGSQRLQNHCDLEEMSEGSSGLVKPSVRIFFEQLNSEVEQPVDADQARQGFVSNLS
jgi:hypothetical protein